MSSPTIDTNRCLVATINLLLILVPTTNTSGLSHSKRHVTNCPQPCYCNEATRAVQCARRGLSGLPVTIPDGTRLLNLNGNKFRSGKIRRIAFSRFPGVVDGILMSPVYHDYNNSLQSSPVAVSELEQLLMSDCSIDFIEPRSFSDLVNLRWLDLSDNLIATISPSTFSGSSLEHLFLNGNRRLVLESDSFAGLSTSGLYLHDCGLTHVGNETFTALIGSLRTLWIQGNRIQRLGPELGPLVTSLVEFRTSSNPLRCDCELVWLKRLYEAPVGEDSRPKIGLASTDSQPTCASPPTLTGRSFADLSTSEFRCRLPVFGDVEAQFDGRSGMLSCAARGSPMPEVRWVRRTPQSQRSPQIVEMSQKSSVNGEFVVSQLVLNTHDNGSAFRRQMSVAIFSCVARNAAGHVTLMVTIQLAVSPEDDLSSYTTSFTQSRSSLSTSGFGEMITHSTRNLHGSVCDDYVISRFANCSDDAKISRSPEVASTEAGLSKTRNVRGYVIKELACAVAVTWFATVALVVVIVTSLPSKFIGNCRSRSESVATSGGNHVRQTSD